MALYMAWAWYMFVREKSKWVKDYLALLCSASCIAKRVDTNQTRRRCEADARQIRSRCVFLWRFWTMRWGDIERQKSCKWDEKHSFYYGRCEASLQFWDWRPLYIKYYNIALNICLLRFKTIKTDFFLADSKTFCTFAPRKKRAKSLGCCQKFGRAWEGDFEGVGCQK